MDDLFFQHGKLCPVCNHKLSLYMVISGVGTFKCSNNFASNKKKRFNFYPLRDDNFGLNAAINKSDNIIVKLLDTDAFFMTFSSESLFRTIEHSRISFFYLCNINSIIPPSYHSINEYQIDSYKVCYYRITNQFHFKYEDATHKLLLDSDNVVKMEGYSLQKDNKKYFLEYSFNDNKTIFYYNEENKEKNLENFVKVFDLLSYYPDFSEPDKVINKFDSWIILS